MKYGIEAEGRLKGVPTIFCDANALRDGNGVQTVYSALKKHLVSHLYVSDEQNTLDYKVLADTFPSTLITIEVTVAQRCPARPNNITLMVRNPKYSDLCFMKNTDQLKFEEDRNVFVFPMGAAVCTEPSDFNNDLDIYA